MGSPCVTGYTYTFLFLLFQSGLPLDSIFISDCSIGVPLLRLQFVFRRRDLVLVIGPGHWSWSLVLVFSLWSLVFGLWSLVFGLWSSSFWVLFYRVKTVTTLFSFSTSIGVCL